MKKLEFERNKIEKMELAAYKGKDFWKDFKNIRNPIKEETLPSARKLQSFFKHLYMESDKGTNIPESDKHYIPMVNLSKRISLEVKNTLKF